MAVMPSITAIDFRVKAEATQRRVFDLSLVSAFAPRALCHPHRSTNYSSGHDGTVFHVKVLVVEARHGAPEAKLRAFPDLADLLQVREGQHQRPAREPVGDVNGRATAAERNERTAAAFEHERLAAMTCKRGLGVRLELAIERDGGQERTFVPRRPG